MTDPSEPGFEEVERGPEPSDEPEAGTGEARDLEGANPTVLALQDRFGDAVLRHEVHAGDEHVVFVEPARNREILQWLKEDPDQHFDLLADVTAVDYGGGRPIQVVYQLWSIPHRRALRVKCELPLSELAVDSVVPLWAAADWLEREVYDMFGVHFRDHPDLRRILMPENYAEGHPLRKDFPLRGRFSRAEQTRRALSQEPTDHYLPSEFEGREPQIVPGHGGGRPPREGPGRDGGPVGAEGATTDEGSAGAEGSGPPEGSGADEGAGRDEGSTTDERRGDPEP